MTERAETLLNCALFPEIADRLGALCGDGCNELLLAMLGQEYVIRRTGVTLRGQKAPDAHAEVIRSYLSSRGAHAAMTPWRGIADFPEGSAGALREQVELPLAQHAAELAERAERILPLCDGGRAASMIGSDLSFTVRALPRIYLHIELSKENQEFPSEAWVLFSNNADAFLPTGRLLQLGELFKERLLGLLRIY